MKNQEEKTDERGDGKEIGEREGDTVRMNEERKMEKGDWKKGMRLENGRKTKKETKAKKKGI